MITTSFVPLAAITLASLVAAWMDVFSRRIPNWLCGVTAIAGLATGAVAGGLSGLGSQFAHMAIVLVAGMAMFRIGIFGGGDAKFYAAVAAWFPLANAVRLLVSITSCGLILFLVWFAYRRARRLPISRKKSDDLFDSLPYGVAIGAGAIMTEIFSLAPLS